MSDDAHEAPVRAEQYYLWLLVPYDILHDIEPHVRSVSAASGVALYDTRLRLRKPGLTLLTSSADRDALANTAAALSAKGYIAQIVARSELRDVPMAAWATRLARLGDALLLCSSDGAPLMRIDRATHVLMVAANVTETSDRRLRDATEHGWRPVEVADALRRMAGGTLVLRAFSDAQPNGVMLSSARFNYDALEAAKGYAAGANMLAVVEQIQAAAGATHIDIDADIADRIPIQVAVPESDQRTALERLEVHARTVFLLWRAGTLAALERRAASSRGPMASDLGNHADAKPASAVATQAAVEPEPTATLRAVRDLVNQLRAIGPLIVVVPLIATMGVAFAAARETGQPACLLLGVAALGVLGILWGYRSFRRKRLIEDFPTSKVRSLALGHVELVGKAVQSTPLKTPFSGIDCVYYRARIEERHDFNPAANRTRSWRVRRVLSSGPQPFYVEDETGRILVKPEGALFEIGTEHVLDRPLADGVDWGRPGRATDALTRRYVEAFIPAGMTVYVLGTADVERPMPGPTLEHRAARLRELKRDPARLAEYDRNFSGEIEDHEWREAVADVDRTHWVEVLERSGETRPEPVVRRGELDDFFLISDHNPDELVFRLHAFSILGIWGGLALVAVAAYQALRLLAPT